jgi:hypothetical protein
MNNRELANRLAREIFEAPHGIEPDAVRRIQFKGGRAMDETDLGGFCEAALADHLFEVLGRLHLPTTGATE